MPSANSGDRPSNVGVATRPSDASQAYASATGIVPQYQFVLDVRGDATLNSEGSRKIFPIIAALPERYSINMSSDWNAPYGNTDLIGPGATKIFGSERGDKIREGVNVLGQVTGISSKMKSQSVQVWEGSSAMSFSLDLIFHAKTNTRVDIRDKHLALLKLVAPSEVGGLGGQVLEAPGPTIVGQVWNEKSRKISMQLGTYLFFDNVVIRNVGTDVETLCDEEGIPIAMTVNIEVTTLYASFTAQDIEKAFNGGGG